jgi:hypothetical protein
MYNVVINQAFSSPEAKKRSRRILLDQRNINIVTSFKYVHIYLPTSKLKYGRKYVDLDTMLFSNY